MSKVGKKKESSNRITSGAVKNELTVPSFQPPASSLVGSVASGDSKGKVKSYPLWPEFTENDINAEKWEGAGGKSKEKGKSPSGQCFEDPEGKVEMPSSVEVYHWKRPQEFVAGKLPVIVEDESNIDILTANEHLCHSEMMRAIISGINALWSMNQNKESLSTNSRTIPEQDETIWKPWEHIYSLCKAGKGHMPLYNQYGKHVVKLYWLGCWRKIIVDDLLPFDEKDQLLLPATPTSHELWPMLLSKALIKIAAIDYHSKGSSIELGDYFVIQCLTGWLPETIPLQYSHNENLWELLKKIVPEWKLPEDKSTAPPVPDIEHEAVVVKKPDTSTMKRDPVGSPASKHDKPTGKEPKSSKEGKKKDDKDKHKSVTEEQPVARPVKIEMVVFASFNQKIDPPASLTSLRKMATASEKLRKVGLSNIHPHPVLITKTRSCSLVPPPPVVEVPRWKLIRPHRKRKTPHDEPQAEPDPPKPDQWLEIASPYLGRHVIPLPLDPQAARPRSHVSGSTALNEINEEESNGSEDIKNKDISKTPFSASAESKGASERASPIPYSATSSRSKDGDKSEMTYDAGSGAEEEEEGEGGEEEGGNEKLEENETKDVKTNDQEMNKSTWIDFEEFTKSFTSVIIFHKPSTYPHNSAITELKLNASTGSALNKKGSANWNAAGVSNTTILKTGGGTPTYPRSYDGFPAEERTPSFLFVDNLKPTELVVSFSVLSRWPGFEDRRISDKESVAGASEIASVKQDVQQIASGLLVAEPYSWKSLLTGHPILRIRTTGTRAACLTLPAGRHVLRFLFSSPLGYHIHVSSSTSFVYGDEDAVMTPLQEESCRFVETANHIMSSVEKCMDAVGNPQARKKSLARLHNAHLPYQPDDKSSVDQHYEQWHKSVYSTMCEVMGETKLPGLVFSLRACLLNHSPHPVMDSQDVKETPENWLNRSASNDELTAAIIIQRMWRGTYTRKLMRAYSVQESKEYLTVQETLKTLRTTLQANLSTHALSLLRSLLKERPSLMKKFSFHKDEWNKINFIDHQGNFAEQPPKTWFVVFREVFYVEEEILCVPKLYVPFPTCVLRVINNDNGEEVKRIFQKVSPHVYKKNERGYTFVAEGWTLDQPLVAGKWRMRLIGSTNELPAPVVNPLTSQFFVKEIRDYYVPNKGHIVMRYHVKCGTGHLGSLQFETSKSDVYIKFQILNNDVEVVSTKGKGHCVIPAFYFLSNEAKAAGSQESRPGLSQGSKLALSGAVTGKKGSTKAVEEKSLEKETVDSKPLLSQEELADELPRPNHNYTIQAIVEQKSWPLTRGQWSFVDKLKKLEKEEIKAFSVSKDRAGSPGGRDRQSGGGKPAADKGKKGSKAGDKGGKKQPDKDAGSRPPSQQIYDDSRAFWTLRFVSDMEKNEEVEIKKDIKRHEEIRAMKQAWESAEPGRAIKAMQSRLSYINNNTIKSESSDKENDEEEGQQSDLSPQSPEPLDEKEVLPVPPVEIISSKDFLKPFDTTPYIRPQLSEDIVTQFMDVDQLAELEKEEQKVKNEEYKERRIKSLAFRDQNRHDRRALKEQQLEKCQEMQYVLDKSRTELLKPREQYRQTLLEEKRLKEEEAEAAAAALSLASEPSSPDGKGRKSTGKKKK